LLVEASVNGYAEFEFNVHKRDLTNEMTDLVNEHGGIIIAVGEDIQQAEQQEVVEIHDTYQVFDSNDDEQLWNWDDVWDEVENLEEDD
jgi:hypothetical protein